ncbi:MAG TPA: hypothetical protein VMV95_02630 [Bacillota bacterium]|nr:hypothetical protein [Bacillota bacterium]
MSIYQAFNPKIKAWVKYHFVKDKGFEVFDVKQREPLKPFKNIELKRGKNK